MTSGVGLLLGKQHHLAALKEMEEEISHLRNACERTLGELNPQP